MKKSILFAFLMALSMGLMATPEVEATVTAEAVCYYQPTQIVNGDFSEQPQKVTPPNGTDQGWNTTDNAYEYLCGWMGWHAPDWHDNDDGNCYVEMNANHSAVLYQDLSTNGGDVIRWSLNHAVRTHNGGEDVQDMRVEVGAPNYSGSDIVYPHGVDNDIHTEINADTKATYRSTGITNPTAAEYGFEGQHLEYLSLNKSTQRNAWYNVTGVYVIPEQQPVTRFAFVSEDENDPGCGNFLDNITFSTLIGDLSATYGPEESVIIRGYWGDEDDSKSLKIEVGSQVIDIPMAGMAGQCFSITLPHGLLGSLPTEVTVYHEDYPSASRTIPVNYPMTVSATGVHVDFDGNPHSITVEVTEPADGYTITYGSSYGGCTLTENPAYTNKGTYNVFYQVSKPGYTSVKGMATVQIDAVMLNLTVLTNAASMGSTLMNSVYFEDDFSSATSLPAGWTTSGPSWTVSAGMLKSGAADDQTSELRAQYTLSGAGSISFRYRISSEGSYDFGYFSIDGSNKINGISGSGSWQTFSQDLAAGTHTFRWWYSKDGSYGEGEDAFLIDDISITSLTPTGTDPIAIESGSAVNLIAQPNTGHSFVNWTDGGETTLGTNATLSFTMDANMTAQANFSVNQYTITFNSNGGSAVDPITQDYGTAITAPADPTRDYYTFAGWSQSIPATMPAEDLTLTAQWTVAGVTLDETDATLPTQLVALHNDGVARDITILRTFKAEIYNTCCLPFDLSASEIAASPFAGAVLKEFDGADVTGEGAERDLNIHIADLSEIVAGKPFLIKPDAEIVNPTFANKTVTYTAAMGQNIEREHVDFQGIIAPYDLAAYSNSSPDYLGIGNDGRLYWADGSKSTGPMRGFRAFFHVKDAGASLSPVRRGMRAQFVEDGYKMPTDINQIDNRQSTIDNRKVLINGQLLIIRDGKIYNATGAEVK